ncbi:MAG TPA: SRPBCC family protein [Ktedonobacterales bacterium]
MAHMHVQTERVIDASPDVVYSILADYRGARQRILPPEHYLEYGVERGGAGAGTTFHYRLRAGGRERPYTMTSSEPAPGRVITEQDSRSSLTTTWTLAPLGDGRRTRVQLMSEWEGGRGIGGFFERLFAPGGLRRIYTDMLNRLDQQATQQGRAPLTSGSVR